MNEAPKYIGHNEALAIDFNTKHSITSMYPAAHLQVPCVALNRQELFAGGYNPSLIPFRTGYLMAYRWHHNGDINTALAMAELDAEFFVSNNHRITIDGVPEDACVDDPRLFYFRGELYCSFVVAQWYTAKPPTCVMRYGKIGRTHEGWKITTSWQIPYGKNDGQNMEKSWIFFQHGNELYCVYHNDPCQTVLRVSGGEVLDVMQSQTPAWPWGVPHGGTTPAQWETGLLRFYHSRQNNEPPPVPWRYYIGAMVMEDKPPFAIKAVSKTPIIRGSEDDRMTAMERSACFHVKKNVVFPCGSVLRPDSILLSFGVNDCLCEIAKLTKDKLNL